MNFFNIYSTRNGSAKECHKVGEPGTFGNTACATASFKRGLCKALRQWVLIK